MELLSQLQELGVIDKSDQFDLLRDEVEQELQHLGSLKEGVIAETAKLEEVYKTIRDHNTYLVGQLETYKSYLHNVRSQSEGTKRKQQKQQVLGPYKFTHQQLEKEGVIQKSNVPDNRRANIYFNFTSPLPGTFVISLHYKGKSPPPPPRWTDEANESRPKPRAPGAGPQARRPARDAKGQPGRARPRIRPVQRAQGARPSQQAIRPQEGVVRRLDDATRISRMYHDYLDEAPLALWTTS